MSIFEKIGGEPAVEKAVQVFYRKILVDERVSRFFDDVDMEGQMNKQKGFLTMVLGGPHNYKGLDMREGHKHLIENGLNDSHVDVVLELLGDSLKELGVEDKDVAEVANIANSVRDDVLNR